MISHNGKEYTHTHTHTHIYNWVTEQKLTEHWKSTIFPLKNKERINFKRSVVSEANTGEALTRKAVGRSDSAPRSCSQRGLNKPFGPLMAFSTPLETRDSSFFWLEGREQGCQLRRELQEVSLGCLYFWKQETGHALEEETWRKQGEEEVKAQDGLGMQRGRALAAANEQSSRGIWKPSRPCKQDWIWSRGSSLPPCSPWFCGERFIWAMLPTLGCSVESPAQFHT